MRDITLENLDQFGTHLPTVLEKRARHVIEEIKRVKQASLYLVQDNAAGFGELMAAGHRSLKELFEVSLPEMDGLVEIALSLDGCFGARLTGAGFGGCTVNLVKKSKAEKFAASLYEKSKFDDGSGIKTHICQPARGVYAEPRQ